MCARTRFCHRGACKARNFAFFFAHAWSFVVIKKNIKAEHADDNGGERCCLYSRDPGENTLANSTSERKNKQPARRKKASCGEHTEDMLSAGQRVMDLEARSDHFLPTKVLHRSTSQSVLRKVPFRQKFYAFCGACDQPLKEILSFCEGHLPVYFPFWPQDC